MTAVLQGVRILEVAEHTFVPAASALLADWGAEVIKIEHVERGDAMRGLASSGVVDDRRQTSTCCSSTRTAASRASASTSPPTTGSTSSTSSPRPSRRLPDQQAARASARSCRSTSTRSGPHNPNIIYVRGTGQGERGPDADKGSYDALAFWARSGVAIGRQAPGVRPRARPARPRASATRSAAMTIAGGIMGALFHRERTGEATIVDVSLLGTGLWAMGQAIGAVAAARHPVAAAARRRDRAATRCRATTAPRTAASLAFTCLQAGKYWPPLCRRASAGPSWPPTRASPTTSSLDGQQRRRHRDPRPRSSPSAPLAEWRERLDDFAGQWTVVQDTLEAAVDPQTVANGYIQDCETADGIAVPARRRAGAVRRGAAGRRSGRPSSTSTATPSSPSSGSTGTPSSTSRSAASSPDAPSCRGRSGAVAEAVRVAGPARRSAR